MNSSKLFHIDFSLLLPSIILVFFSLITLSSINGLYVKNQLFSLLISLIAFVFFAQIHFSMLKVQGKAIYVVAMILLLVVLLIGFESRGAVRWVTIFGFQMQFSEILKPFLAISLASFLSGRNLSFKTLFIAFTFLLPIVFLIFLQPDLGNALLYVFVVVFSLVVIGFPLIWFLVAFIFSLVTAPIFWQFLHDYQKQRIVTFIHPTNDPLGTSYNAVQSIIAVGSGSFFGKGLGESTQSGLRFLPERHTDFIFATLSEGLGLFGGLIVIACFVYLLYRIFLIFTNSNDTFCKMFAVIAFFLVFVQCFVNIGMNIGILPIVGVTLPFVSYGGSSLLSNFILLGFLSSISSSYSDRRVLEIK